MLLVLLLYGRDPHVASLLRMTSRWGIRMTSRWGTLSEVRNASEVAIAVKFLVLLKVKFCLRKVKAKFLAL